MLAQKMKQDFVKFAKFLLVYVYCLLYTGRHILLLQLPFKSHPALSSNVRKSSSETITNLLNCGKFKYFVITIRNLLIPITCRMHFLFRKLIKYYFSYVMPCIFYKLHKMDPIGETNLVQEFLIYATRVFPIYSASLSVRFRGSEIPNIRTTWKRSFK